MVLAGSPSVGLSSSTRSIIRSHRIVSVNTASVLGAPAQLFTKDRAARVAYIVVSKGEKLVPLLL